MSWRSNAWRESGRARERCHSNARARRESARARRVCVARAGRARALVALPLAPHRSRRPPRTRRTAGPPTKSSPRRRSRARDRDPSSACSQLRLSPSPSPPRAPRRRCSGARRCGASSQPSCKVAVANSIGEAPRAARVRQGSRGLGVFWIYNQQALSGLEPAGAGEGVALTWWLHALRRHAAPRSCARLGARALDGGGAGAHARL